MVRRLRAIGPTLATLVVLAAGASAASSLVTRAADFAPFVMTIDAWTSARMGFADGTTIPGTFTHRLEYRRWDDWRLTLVATDHGREVGDGAACVDGLYTTFDRNGRQTGSVDEPAMCPGVNRWIFYGVEWGLPFARDIVGERVIYTHCSERIVVDRRSGLPLLYEVRLPDGRVAERIEFRLAR